MQSLWDFLVKFMKDADEMAPFHVLQRTMQDTPYPPSRKTLEDLSRALANGLPLTDCFFRCVDTIASQFPILPSAMELRRASEPLQVVIKQIQIALAQRQLSTQQQRSILVTLNRAADVSIPLNTPFPDFLSHPLQLHGDLLNKAPQMSFVASYCTAYIQGEEAKVNQMRLMALKALSEPN